MANQHDGIPTHCSVLVIGGGPAGSMAAILLAREGHEVVLLERETFPRYHIGESLLTSAIPVLKFVDLYERMEQHGFVRKYGGYFVLKKDTPPGHIDFRRVSVHGHSYQVIRSEFDHLLLKYAAEMGASVHEATSVGNIDFDGERPVRAHWRKKDGTSGALTFDYLIDATGLSGLLATRYLRNRTFQEHFANVAVGGYWSHYEQYRAPDGSLQGGDFFMEALSDGSGWVWAIPLHDGTISIGIVVHVDQFKRLRAEGNEIDDIYRKGLALAPTVSRMLAEATNVGETRVWQDYSYIARKFSGPGYFLIGDAAAFIDPLFSTGVHLAFLGALSSAASIASLRRGEITEAEATSFHDPCVRKAYVRFAIIVAGMYRQIRDQQNLVLYGVDGSDFRRAFEIILPIISGNADLPEDLVPPDVLDRTARFTIDMVRERARLGSDNAAARMVLERSGVHEDLASDPSLAIDGRYINMVRGQLGLVRLSDEQAAEVGRQKQELQRDLGEAARRSG